VEDVSTTAIRDEIAVVDRRLVIVQVLTTFEEVEVASQLFLTDLVELVAVWW
jgi:hypothetical protein